MSLAMAVSQPNFIIASSDTAVTKFPIDEEAYRETGKIVRDYSQGIIKTPFKSQKTHNLSDKVFLLAVGHSTITETFKVEMLERVKANSDLKTSVDIAKQVFQDMQEKTVPNYKKTLANLAKEWRTPIEKLEPGYWVELENMNDLQFSSYLIGFNEDGTNGIYQVETDSYSQGPSDNQQGYPVVIAGEHPGYSREPKNFSEYQKSLTFHPEDRTIANFTDAMTIVHGKISYDANVNVSPDCHFHILLKTEEGYEYGNIIADTSFLHPLFEQKTD